MSAWPEAQDAKDDMVERAAKRVQRSKLLGRLQELVGLAKNTYLNDRDPNAADKIIPALEEAFEICVKLRERYVAR